MYIIINSSKSVKKKKINITNHKASDVYSIADVGGRAEARTPDLSIQVCVAFTTPRTISSSSIQHKLYGQMPGALETIIG